jgi:hypothetical protein
VGFLNLRDVQIPGNNDEVTCVTGFGDRLSKLVRLRRADIRTAFQLGPARQMSYLRVQMPHKSEVQLNIRRHPVIGNAITLAAYCALELDL